jgi:hypothetical protein
MIYHVIMKPNIVSISTTILLNQASTALPTYHIINAYGKSHCSRLTLPISDSPILNNVADTC